MSINLETILGTYLVIGVLLAAFGPAAKEISAEIVRARGNALLHAYMETQAPSELKLFLFRIVITGGFIVLWPVFIVSILKSQRKSQAELEEVLNEHAKGLKFPYMGGCGTIVCKECHFSQSITSFTHGHESSTSGYQCQSCGDFHSIRTGGPGNASEIKDSLLCNCGGQLDREKVVFCPSCKSTQMAYSVEFMT